MVHIDTADGTETLLTVGRDTDNDKETLLMVQILLMMQRSTADGAERHC